MKNAGANWYVPVGRPRIRTSMYRYQEAQDFTDWYKQAPDFLVWYKTVHAITRFPQLVQDGTKLYQQVQDISGLVPDSDGTSKYKISSSPIGTRLYKMV